MRAIFDRLHEPRWTTTGYIGAYSCSFLLGFVLVAAQPYGLAKVIDWLPLAAGMMLLVGGSSAAACALFGKWIFERAAIWAIAGGYAMTLPAILLTQPLNAFMRTGVTILIIQYGWFVLFARYHAIKWAYLDPGR